jgi:hypothetical protein
MPEPRFGILFGPETTTDVDGLAEPALFADLNLDQVVASTKWGRRE